MSKVAVEKAYKAGFALPDVQWGEDATDEQRTPGVHHCPFDARNPDQAGERAAWIRGLIDRLEAPTKDPAEVLKEAKAALKEATA